MPGAQSPVERQEGPVLGAAAPGAGRRGRLRPHGGHRFRHTAQFVRWRPDRDPRSCTYEQLERAGQLRPGRVAVARAERTARPVRARLRHAPAVRGRYGRRMRRTSRGLTVPLAAAPRAGRLHDRRPATGATRRRPDPAARRRRAPPPPRPSPPSRRWSSTTAPPAIAPQLRGQPGGDRPLSFFCGRLRVPLDYRRAGGEGDRAVPGPGAAGRPAAADRLAGGQPRRAGRLRRGRRGRAGADAADRACCAASTSSASTRAASACPPRSSASPPTLKDRAIALDPDARTEAAVPGAGAVASEIAQGCLNEVRRGRCGTTTPRRPPGTWTWSGRRSATRS